MQTREDVDYLGTQGFWVCTLVAAWALIFVSLAGHPIAAVLTALFYFVGGVGVRERSRYAAAIVLLMSVMDTLAGVGAVRLLINVVLLSNLRATWIASAWRPAAENETPLRPERDLDRQAR